MELNEDGNNEDNDEIMCLDDEPEMPPNYGSNNHNTLGGYRRRGRHAPQTTQVFNKSGQTLGSRFTGSSGRSGFYWGRGYGPAGPPGPPVQQSYDNLSFLLQCGVQHQTLNGLPNVLLRLMDPETCGVCAQEFDNIGVARLHYNTKNHVKNVKKWLTQQAKVGSIRPKEIPVRSRELYCELCDIHNTSKIHADSHYSGRSHRAIVEGRKPPKNPFLLQKNMQLRVEKLIRREKRCLKPIEKPAAVEKPKPDKHIMPELYCNICQTSVTCTEQMTMHLNGKKHLSKEKRHILNMMNGETSKNANAQGAAAQSTEAQGAAAQSTDAQGAAAQSTEAQGAEAQGEETNDSEEDDWGQGSGTWDDDPQ